MRSRRGLCLRRLAGANGVRDPPMLGGGCGRLWPEMQGEQPRAVGLIAHGGRDAREPAIAAALGQHLVETLVGGGPVEQSSLLQGLLHCRGLPIERFGRGHGGSSGSVASSAAAMPSTAISTS